MKKFLKKILESDQSYKLNKKGDKGRSAEAGKAHRIPLKPFAVPF
jgi:hypothetical protein